MQLHSKLGVSKLGVSKLEDERMLEFSTILVSTLNDWENMVDLNKMKDWK